MWLCGVLQLCTPTAGPEVCLQVFLWRDPASLNAKKPTASMGGKNTNQSAACQKFN